MRGPGNPLAVGTTNYPSPPPSNNEPEVVQLPGSGTLIRFVANVVWKKAGREI